MLGFLQPFSSIPPSQEKWSLGHWTGHETGHTVPSLPLVIGMHVSGIGHPAASVPPGQVVWSGGHTLGQNDGQVPTAEQVTLKVF